MLNPSYRSCMRLLFFASCALALLTACGGGGGTAAAPAGPLTTCPIPVAKANPSWRTDIYPLLQGSCGSASPLTCHDGASPPGHLAYSGTSDQVYARLVGAVPANAPAGPGWALVKAGDPAHSWIMEKVTKDQPGGSGYGTRMPYGAPNLCQPTIATLSAWINAGAPNN